MFCKWFTVMLKLYDIRLMVYTMETSVFCYTETIIYAKNTGKKKRAAAWKYLNQPYWRPAPGSCCKSCCVICRIGLGVHSRQHAGRPHCQQCVDACAALRLFLSVYGGKQISCLRNHFHLVVPMPPLIRLLTEQPERRGGPGSDDRHPQPRPGPQRSQQLLHTEVEPTNVNHLRIYNCMRVCVGCATF